MTDTTLDATEVKTLVKEAFIELLQEKREMFHDLFAEVIEDIALLNAIREGETTESLDREQVFQILDGVA